ncbi:MAG: endonuclease/exonuclease/phosphatase family protein [Bacteroidales bacterium]|jgi:endonuclease/exonuclease/phosphatase family metal-dependent hydrolase|nr:endonuclease/exonuclease/phosphatase family protein [Bacteroidales bacterium]
MNVKKSISILGLCLLGVAAVSSKKADIRVATYNLRLNTTGDGENAWPNRKEEVKALIRFHDFEIFGTQEGLPEQISDLCEMSEYRYIGGGRDDGKNKGEHSAIFYKPARFQLLDSGDFWLRETPETPGKGWDATCCNRICSWGKFKDLQSRKTFFFFNVHFDHQGVVARRESGKLMVQKIREIAGDNVVICTGDFNSTPDSEQIHTMKGLLNDAREISVAPPYGPEGTFNGWDFNAPLKTRIDYVFLSKQITALKYGVLTDSKNRRYPSDHQPVVVDIEF